MRRLIPLFLFLMVVAIVRAEEREFNLLKIEHVGPKGRVQEYASDPVIESILASGQDAIPILIDLLDSERPYERTPIDYWPEVREGDMALIILCNLFLDPTWRKSTLPQLCWDNLLERDGDNISAWELLGRYVSSHGRSRLVQEWKTAWFNHRDNIVWDEEGRYFRVVGQELVVCQ